MPEGQLDHLRGVGLLPPLPVVQPANVNCKAAKLLGVEDTGPSIELLEEDNGDNSADTLQPDDDETSASAIGNNDKESDGSSSLFDPYAIRLLRSAHISYLTKALSIPLSRGFVSLDASHPWMVYWCLHSLDLLGYFDTNKKNGNSSAAGLSGSSNPLEDVEVLQKGHLLERIVSTLEHCWTDVDGLDFDLEEVEQDVRLKQLVQDQKMDTSSYNDNEGKQVVSISGGGFGGGPHQMPHSAPTYAAVLSLCIVASIGLEQPSSSHPYHKAGQLALEFLSKRRLQLYAFFLTLREREKGDDDNMGDVENERIAFRMQHDGEIDVRASYCILAPCYLLGLLDNVNEERPNGGQIANNPLQSPAISRNIAACQTFEGGFGAEPFNEAHGGYTFCALAALRILNSVDTIDVPALSSWLARRQMGYEGGFCGRTNKLVDGCYSFWQGGAVAVFDGWHSDKEVGDSPQSNDCVAATKELSFDEVMLQRYILLCAQDVNGGLRDKPSKPKDFYHSCYNLSGLSVAQHALEAWPPSNEKVDDNKEEEMLNSLFGDKRVNIVGRTDPVINIRVERVKFMQSQSFS